MKISRFIIVLFAIVVLSLLLMKLFEVSANKSSDDVYNETLTTIFSRKSVRAYTQQPVTRTQLDLLVRAGMAAPTAVNKQPWAFIIIEDRAILDSLAEGLPHAKMLTQATAAIVVCGDTQKSLLNKDQAYWVQDCSAASENILLAAESLGLGAVWTGVFPREERMVTVSTLLSLPSHIIPLNVIPVGYPLHDEAPKDKYKPKNVHYNKW